MNCILIGHAPSTPTFYGDKLHIKNNWYMENRSQRSTKYLWNTGNSDFISSLHVLMMEVGTWEQRLGLCNAQFRVKETAEQQKHIPKNFIIFFKFFKKIPKRVEKKNMGSHHALKNPFSPAFTFTTSLYPSYLHRHFFSSLFSLFLPSLFFSLYSSKIFTLYDEAHFPILLFPISLILYCQSLDI